MPEPRLGIVVSGAGISGVLLDFSNDPPVLMSQFTWSLQAGDRAGAYLVMYERLVNFVREQSVCVVAVKSSALSTGGTSIKHLESAELRGIAIVAAATAGAKVEVVAKAVVSRTFGSRKADAYIEDNLFWTNAVEGELAKTRREAALMLLAASR